MDSLDASDISILDRGHREMAFTLELTRPGLGGLLSRKRFDGHVYTRGNSELPEFIVVLNVGGDEFGIANVEVFRGGVVKVDAFNKGKKVLGESICNQIGAQLVPECASRLGQLPRRASDMKPIPFSVKTVKYDNEDVLIRERFAETPVVRVNKPVLQVDHSRRSGEAASGASSGASAEGGSES